MLCTMEELRSKDVINLINGENLGRVDDLQMDAQTASVMGLILHGRPRCFGLLGRQEDCTIQTEQIRLIGKDAILVTIPDQTSADGKQSLKNFQKI